MHVNYCVIFMFIYWMVILTCSNCLLFSLTETNSVVFPLRELDRNFVEHIQANRVQFDGQIGKNGLNSSFCLNLLDMGQN